MKLSDVSRYLAYEVNELFNALDHSLRFDVILDDYIELEQFWFIIYCLLSTENRLVFR